MDLDRLIDLIETVRGRIERHGRLLVENETRTRTASIDPILRALGWEVSDPGAVVPQYDIGGRLLPGYALFARHDDKPAALVETRRLGATLGDYRAQLIDDVARGKIDYAVLTDGNDWELYDMRLPVPLAEKRVFISITKGVLPKIALDFLPLWRRSLATTRTDKPAGPGLGDPEVLLFAEPNRPDVTHTRLLDGQFDGARPIHGKWDGMVALALAHVYERAADVDELHRVSGVRVVREHKMDHGYKYIKEKNISYPGLSAQNALAAIVKCAKAYDFKVSINFEWRHNEKAMHPGRRGRFTVG